MRWVWFLKLTKMPWGILKFLCSVCLPAHTIRIHTHSHFKGEPSSYILHLKHSIRLETIAPTNLTLKNTLKRLNVLSHLQSVNLYQDKCEIGRNSSLSSVP